VPHLYQRGSTWWCSFYVDGRRIQRSTRCTDRKAADLAARRFERDGADPAHAAQASATVALALSSFLEHVSHQRASGALAPATEDFYASKTGHIARVLGDATLLRHVDAVGVRRYLQQRRAEGAGEHTLVKELTTLRQVLRNAKLTGLFAGDLEAIVPRVSSQYEPRTRVLIPDELEALRSFLLPDRSAQVAFMVATGAEFGAVGRARWEDIHHDEPMVHIRGTKRALRDRWVPVVLEYAWRLLVEVPLLAEGTGGLIFRPWTKMQRDIQNACIEAGIAHTSPNDLRRTYATWHHAAGISLEHLAPAMGHSSTVMLSKVYGKLPPVDLVRRMTASLAGSR